MQSKIGLQFIYLGLIAFLVGLFFGSIGAFQFVFPEKISKIIPFYKTRPIHVSLVISWIILSASGGVYYYMEQISTKKLFSYSLANTHFYLFLFTGIIILICYVLGIFGGREYLEFPYILIAPILIGWIFFAINFFKTVKPDFKNMPVYFWMWSTGVVFMILTLLEAYLWLIPFFKENIIRDLTVQWKSYGAFIGSWNMLIYGTAAFVMCRIGSDECTAHKPIVFFLYFLGLTNLMFNWGHHTYLVPAKPWIKYISYIISETELIILAKIIWDWKNTLTNVQKNHHQLAYRFLLAGEFWVFLNLILALLISIPALNLFTHGTHITVAHSMGATIGINTMILLGSVFFIFSQRANDILKKNKKIIDWGFWIVQVSLAIFWLMLIIAGARKGYLTYFSDLNFNDVMKNISPYLLVFSFAGIGLLAGFSMIIFPLLRELKRMVH